MKMILSYLNYDNKGSLFSLKHTRQQLHFHKKNPMKTAPQKLYLCAINKEIANPRTVASVGTNTRGIGSSSLMICVNIRTAGTAMTASQKFV